MNDADVVRRIKKLVPLGETRKVSDLAKRIRVRRSVIEDVTGGDSGLDLIVGARIPGVGHYESKSSEYEVEHYE